MAVDIRDVVCESADCKGVFVGILALEQQFANEISAANVVHQVAEFRAAEWVVSEILDDGTPISIGMGFFELVVRQIRESRQQERPDLIAPEKVDDLLVG